MNKKLLFLVVLSLPLSIASCKSKSESLPSSLRDVYGSYFKIGAAVNKTTKTNEIVSEFSSITAENDMKWEAVHPLIDTYSFDTADTYINIAKQNNQGVRGHALVWHQAIPSYVFYNESNELRSKEEILDIERNHIRTVVRHFGDNVYCWDVCNEVVDDTASTPLKEDQSNIYRESMWYQTCGDDYIKVAFETADEVLKELGLRDKVSLIYNDYSNTTPIKREKTIAMLNNLLENNVPIDGIGLQSHYHLGNFSMDQLEDSIKTYSAMGLDVQITEFDVEIYDKESNEFELQDFKKYENVLEENINMQASIYDRAFEIFRRYSDKISSVTFWGTTDSSCYMNVVDETGGNSSYGYHTNYPFLFDRQNNKKPCYYAIIDFGKYLNKRYNPYSNVTSNNTYNGDGNELHVSKFSPDNIQIISRPEQQSDGSFKVSYYTVDGYNFIGSSVSGRLADFTYINILAKGIPGKNIAVRLFHSNQENETHNLLGNDISFSLEENFSIHTLKVKSVYHSRMDLLTKVAIYPDLGVEYSSGEFYYKDIWFSNEIPEGSVLENPGVDTGDTSKTVNGFTYENWTGYTLYNASNGTGVSYVEAKDYAYISTDLSINSEENNALLFAFENVIEFNVQTVSHIRFVLRGDVSGEGISEEGYPYPIYFEEYLYTYNVLDANHVLPDGNNITTLEIPLANAINKIGNNHENGYHLAVFIESFAPEKSVYDMSRDGKMIITDCHVFDGKYVKELYTQTEDQSGFQYILSDKDGVDKNISYTDIKGNKYWPVIYRSVEMNHDQKVTINVRNNGDEIVSMGIHAGILNDKRSDELNHMFYPLWKAYKGEKNPSGYYIDGETYFINPNETIEVTIYVDNDDMYASDAINTIEFLFDNNYNDELLRSGNVDVVSVVIEDI